MSMEQDLSKFIAKALNKTIQKLANEQNKAIKQEVDLPLKKIKAMGRVQKARANNLQASIKTLHINLSLNNFKKSLKTQNKKIIGVNVKLNKNKKLFLPGHFVAKSRARGGDFIAIRENSKQMKNPALNYKASSKSYPDFKGRQNKLLYPSIKESFDTIAKAQSKELSKKAKLLFEISLKEIK